MNKEQILNYRIVGNGYPVVFLHGFLESNKMWENLLKHLPHIQAICIELPGHGKSKLLEQELSLNNITEAVKLTILEITNEAFSIVGHSLGGYVALHLAEDISLSINEIVLQNSHPWPDGVTKKNDRHRTARVVEYNKSLFLNEAIPRLYYKAEFYETKINELIDEANLMGEDAIIQSLYAMRDRSDKNHVLESWKEKIHIIQGEFDHLIDAKKLEKQAKENNNKFHLIKNIGHMAHHENEIEVARLLGFLWQNLRM
ncbi:alpha/beta fold hydrolase [Brumimicrobium mesophilum]|uniref:alpha/beta fold hydrolase n=1 Tax=Brumimicrobium mesophilum TaxID=392717 RepID=UPI000D143C85|nr:alpha/beta hydrolase [Brumimicrobium mesophilum]